MTDYQFFGLCAVIFVARAQSASQAWALSFICLVVGAYLRVTT